MRVHRTCLCLVLKEFVFFESTEVAQEACDCRLSSFLIVRIFALIILRVSFLFLSSFCVCLFCFSPHLVLCCVFFESS